MILKCGDLFNDNETDLRNIMFGAIVMHCQFICSPIVEHTWFMIAESDLKFGWCRTYIL